MNFLFNSGARQRCYLLLAGSGKSAHLGRIAFFAYSHPIKKVDFSFTVQCLPITFPTISKPTENIQDWTSATLRFSWGTAMGRISLDMKSITGFRRSKLHSHLKRSSKCRSQNSLRVCIKLQNAVSKGGPGSLP
jgi:hypothetical protein